MSSATPVGRHQPHQLGDVERVAARCAGARPRRSGSAASAGSSARTASGAEAGELDPLDARVALDLAAGPPGTRPRPPCRRRPAARARPARRATTWASSRSEDASAQCRSSSTISSGRVGRGGREQVRDGVVEPQPLLLAAGAGAAPSSGPSAGSASPATRLRSARTTGRQTPYGRPSASPRPAHRDAAAVGRPRWPARRAASSCRCPVSPRDHDRARARRSSACVERLAQALELRAAADDARRARAASSARARDQPVERARRRSRRPAGRSAGSGATSARISRSSASGTPGTRLDGGARRAHPEQVLGVERPHAAQQLVERHAEREQVASAASRPRRASARARRSAACRRAARTRPRRRRRRSRPARPRPRRRSRRCRA